MSATAKIALRGVTKSFGPKQVLQGIDLDVAPGESMVVIGGSGSGKSVLLRTIIGLIPKRAGTIELFGRDVDALDEMELRVIQQRWGVMFQHGALFSSLTVRQNIQFQMRENLDLSERMMEEITSVKLEMVGLQKTDANKMPSQLSGGMIKRAALARALALEPEFMLLDEPFAGVDPIAVGEIQRIVRFLRDRQIGVLITDHNVRETLGICDHAYIISEGSVLAEGKADEIIQNDAVRRVYLGENFRM